MADKDKRFDSLDKSKFEFVQAEKKIYDKKFETKPVGYFKDAMNRFVRNKTNLIASIILLTLILLSIFVPIFSTKNAEILEERLAYLPPRIPLLEKIGIADGTKMRYDQPVNPETIDPETGLGLPFSTNPIYIQMNTLENYYMTCTERDELCLGGEVELLIDRTARAVQVRSTAWVTLMQAFNSKIVVDVERMTSGNNEVLYVQIGPILGQYVTIGEITEPGVYEFDPYVVNNVPLSARIQLRFASDTRTSRVSLNSVAVTSDSENPAHSYYADGYNLSRFTLVTEPSVDGVPGIAGSIVRANGQRLMSSFRFDAYGEAFGERNILAFSANEYNRLMEEYADICIPVMDPRYPDGWIFENEDCPFARVIQQNESVYVPGKGEQFSYQLVLNYRVYMGYDEIPYFLFGTSAAGKDMVKLIWIGLRTSLTIGFLVAVINISIGIVYGAISGYYGGQIDIIMERFSEIIGRIPWLVTLSIFIALIGPGIQTLIYVMIVSGWIGVASVTRTQFYRYKGREYVLASRTLGAKDARLIFRHILPNGIGTIITSSILMIPALIFTEATLSYLGFGIGHGQSFDILGINMSGVSIGVLLSDGRNQLRQNPHLTLFPAIIISILMITFNMFGNALRDAFNPALRGSE